MKPLTTIITIFLIANISVYCQINSEYETIEPVNLRGPRIGFTLLDAAKVNENTDFVKINGNFITQFGWQFETMYFALDNGTAGLVEAVVLIGGLEQNLFLPSGNILIGLRNSKGIEFGFGPNLSLSGAAFVIAFGVTIRSKYLNFPINFAIVPSQDGTRFSMISGFNARVNNNNLLNFQQ